jgi:hypothetical protein
MSYYFQGFPSAYYDVLANGKKVEIVDIFRTVRLKKGLRDDVLLYKSYDIQDNERPDHVSIKLYGSADYYWTFFMINENLVNVYKDWPLGRAELEHKIDVKYTGYVLKTTEDFSTKFKVGETIKGAQSFCTATIVEKDMTTGVIKIDNISSLDGFRPSELIVGLTSNDAITITGQVKFKEAPHHYEKVDGTYAMPNDIGAYPVTFEEWERILNEEKTKIRVIRPEYISLVSQEFFNQINPEE